MENHTLNHAFMYRMANFSLLSIESIVSLKFALVVLTLETGGVKSIHMALMDEHV